MVQTRPPTRSRASMTVTAAPIAVRSYAAVSPASPAPATSTDTPDKAAGALAAESLEEAGVIPIGTVGAIGNPKGKLMDDVHEVGRRLHVHRLIHIVRRQVVTLRRPLLSDHRFVCVGVVAHFHGEGRNTPAHEAVLIAARKPAALWFRTHLDGQPQAAGDGADVGRQV